MIAAATPTLAASLERAAAGQRLAPADALALLRAAPLHELLELGRATRARLRPGDHASYIVNANINYTNVCVTRCGFCSFYREPGAADGYVLDHEEVVRRVRAAQARGATQVLLQGGHHPRLGLDYFVELLGAVRDTGAWVHALSAPELVHLARVSRRPVEDVLRALRDAGLQTLPGGGAEVLVDSVRRAISPLKVRAAEWLRVHELAHGLGVRSSATLMFGTVHDGPAEWVEHLAALRDLQDRTGGFTAFIAWTYQRGAAPVEAAGVTASDYLRLLAVSRLFLDGVGTIQASPLTQGPDVATLALQAGADDLGNVLLEEHVVAAAGCEAELTEERARRLIGEAGLVPRRRDTLYRLLPEAGRARPLPRVG